MLDLTISAIFTFQIVHLEKAGQGHEVQFRNNVIRWQMSVYKCLFFIFFIFCKDRICRPFLRTKVTHRHINGQAQAIGEILQICLKATKSRQVVTDARNGEPENNI